MNDAEAFRLFFEIKELRRQVNDLQQRLDDLERGTVIIDLVDQVYDWRKTLQDLGGSEYR